MAPLQQQKPLPPPSSSRTTTTRVGYALALLAFCGILVSQFRLVEDKRWTFGSLSPPSIQERTEGPESSSSTLAPSSNSAMVEQALPTDAPTMEAKEDTDANDNKSQTTTETIPTFPIKATESTTIHLTNFVDDSHFQPISNESLTMHPQQAGVISHILDPAYGKESESKFCLPWHVSSDDWWTHHVTYRVVDENDSGYCYEKQQLNEGISQLNEIYENQFQGNCSNVLTKRMWSSGWGADMSNVLDGIWYGVREKVPFAILDNHWHYASKKDRSKPVCPSETMECFFLPLSGCAPRPDNVTESAYWIGPPSMEHPLNRRQNEFATRPRTWLRKAVYDFSKKYSATERLSDPDTCAVVHVRRADVILHGDHARRYFPMREYVEGLAAVAPLPHGEPTTHNRTTSIRSVFLLTDDANAIAEATTEYPEIDWVYIDRPRFKGSEGGWENQIPSDDPKFEVITLLSIFATAPRCKVLVHTYSNLPAYISAGMRDRWGSEFKVRNLNAQDSFHQVFNANFSKSETTYLNKTAAGGTNSSKTRRRLRERRKQLFSSY